MKFISVDPSLSNTAVVYGNINYGKLEFIDWRIASSKKSADKVPVMEDRLCRIKDIFEVIDDIVDVFKPDVCFGEYPSGSQSSAASVSVGISLSILAKLPNLIPVTPMDVKKVVSNGVVSKDDVMGYCLSKYPAFPYEKKSDGTLIKARMEHVCDAIAIAVAGVKKMKI